MGFNSAFKGLKLLRGINTFYFDNIFLMAQYH